MAITAPQSNPTDHNVREVTDHLLRLRGLTLAELTIAVGLTKSTMNRRRVVGGWSASEVAAIATHLHAPVQVFYDGPDALFREDFKSQRDGVTPVNRGYPGANRTSPNAQKRSAA